jgi:predicted transport protein
MSDIKLFRLAGDKAGEMQGVASDLEKPLQTLIEKNLEALLGVRFLSTEYVTGKTHGGRIDTLGLDENNSPVILEYKRSAGENVINQGLFYLNWLMDHQAEFELLVLKRLSKASADAIDWSAPRVVCIASDFTKYDAHAVEQIGRNIELIRYKQFGTEFLLFELVNAVSGKTIIGSKQPFERKRISKTTSVSRVSPVYGTAALVTAKPEVRELFASLEGFIMSLGDDVQRKDLKLYIAFKRIRNFAAVEVYKDKLLLHVSLNPDHVDLVEGFTRDVRSIGHWGTGDLEIWVRNNVDLERAKPLIKQAHDGGRSSG